MTTVCHIVDRATWNAAREAGRYAPASLDREGFIHLSQPHQVAATAARFFAGVPDLVVLIMRAEPLGADLRWETTDDDTFPHLHASLDPALVTEVVPLADFATRHGH
jgi:uncharacterized protein (DUF952 family)